MSLIREFLVVFLVHSALSSEDLIHPCMKDDRACLTQSAQNFLEKTSAGVPAYNLKAIDPFHDEHIEYTFDSGDKLHIHNVTITGLKKMVVAGFKLNTTNKNVNLLMENEPEIVADIEWNGKPGTVSAKGKLVMVADYEYELVPNKDGAQYFTVGPETLRCDPKGVPEVTVMSGLEGQQWNDGIKQKFVCFVSESAFHSVLHNLRESAKVYPACSYFKDLIKC